MKVISQQDIYLLFNKHQSPYVRLELLEKNPNGSFIVLDTIEGNLVSGDYSEDAESEVRRTLSFNLVVTDRSYTVGEFNRIWIDKYVRVYIGKKESRSKEIYWYSKGIYIFNDAQTTFSATDNSVTIY